MEEVGGEKLEYEGKVKRNIEMEKNGIWKMIVDKGLYLIGF